MKIINAERENHSGKVLSTLFLLTYLFVNVTLSYAHNKVVVVPLGGDEIVASEPSTPLSDANTNASDYQLLFGDNPLLGAITVRDRTTGLEWQRGDRTGTTNWNEAWSYCYELGLRNKFDWRLPTILELQSIVDYGNSSPAIEVSSFPFSDKEFYWSATINAVNAQSAWGVGIGGRGDLRRQNKVVSAGIKCVR